MNIHAVIDAEGSTKIDERVERYRIALDKIKGALAYIKAGRAQLKIGREQWIDGTLELSAIVAATRADLPNHPEYSRWLQRNNLEYLSPNDRMALIGFARDPQAARKMLEASRGVSWRSIWEKQSKVGPYQNDKGPPSRRSGSNKRKRAAAIPSVMRDDYVPGEIAKRAAERPAEPKRRRRASRPADRTPPPERPVPKLKGLTREQVDPDFKGDAHEWARTYGLVNLQTKQQIEYNKQQELLMAWLGLLSEHEQTARALLAADAVDPAALREWMARPAKAEKLQRWCTNIQLACESLRKIVEPDVT